jgi:hypothetical protein
VRIVTRTLNVDITTDDGRLYSIYDEETGIFISDLTWEQTQALLERLARAGEARLRSDRSA